MADHQEHPNTIAQDQEVEAGLTRVLRNMVWIKGLNVDKPEYFRAIMSHSSGYTPTAIAAAYHCICDTHGKYRSDLLTDELLDSVTEIIRSIHASIIARACEEWAAEDVRQLVKYFVAYPKDWESSLETIRERRINTYDALTVLLPRLHDPSAPMALHKGTL